MSADFVVPTAAGKLLQKPLEPIAESRPQVSVAPAVPSLPPLPDVELVGTAKDSDDRFSMAWLQLPNNKSPILARLGAQVDSIPGRPTVTAILDGKAILMFGPREKKLELKKNHLEK